MTDRYPRPDPNDGRAGAVRRWLKLIVIALAVVVLLVVVLRLIGGGGHGPSRHIESDDLRATALYLIPGSHG